MIRFYGTFRKLTVDKGRFTIALEQAIGEQVKLAAQAFLRATKEFVPVLTGESQGSLKALGELVGFDWGIDVKLNRRGRNPYTGLQQGHATFVLDLRGSRRVYISFRTDVVQYLVHEGTWRSFEEGKAAFKAYLSAHLKDNVPKIKDFINRTDVTFG